MQGGTNNAMRNHYEDDLQMAVAQYLDLKGYLWTHFPSGGQRHVRVGAKLKRMGAKRGVPDCLIFEPFSFLSDVGVTHGGPGIAIELKKPKTSTVAGRLSPAQEWWLMELKRRGWMVRVCVSIDEVIERVKLLSF